VNEHLHRKHCERRSTSTTPPATESLANVRNRNAAQLNGLRPSPRFLASRIPRRSGQSHAERSSVWLAQPVSDAPLTPNTVSPSRDFLSPALVPLADSLTQVRADTTIQPSGGRTNLPRGDCLGCLPGAHDVARQSKAEKTRSLSALA
jgi:hypothetical protein